MQQPEPDEEPDPLFGRCRALVDALHVSGASVVVVGNKGEQSTICGTDDIALRGDALQLELGEGPRWEVFTTGQPVLCPDLRLPRRNTWPIFASAALQLGMLSVFAFPMKMGAVSVGAVDLYCSAPRYLDKHQVSMALAMATLLAVPAVRRAISAADDHRSEEGSMSPSLRREVHQATGMIQAQLDVDATEAFSLLRAYSFSTGRGIEDIARDVVARRLDFAAPGE